MTLNTYIGGLRKRSKIRELGFISTYFINRTELLHSCFSMFSLSLKGCGIELPKIFEYIDEIHCVELDFSSNYCTLPFNHKILIPSQTTKLSLNGIEWKSHKMLVDIFIASSQAKSPIQLNLANMKMCDNELEQFDDCVNNINSGSIDGLSWNNNKLTSNFKKFITKSSIKFLSLAGINLEKETAFLSQLKVKYLDIHGTSKFKLNKSLILILNCLSQSNVTYINCPHNLMGLDNFESFLDAICNFKTLHGINFDNNGFTNYKVQQNIITKLSKFNKKLKIYYPFIDIGSFASKTMGSKLNELKQAFVIPKYSNSDSSPSYNEWEKVLIGFYQEDNVAIDVDDLPIIEAPNGDYAIESNEEEDDDDFEVAQNSHILELNIMMPSQNVIEKLQQDADNLSVHYIAQQLFI